MDDGLLIEQVSGFPQLYAKSDSRFKNIRLKENAWKTTAIIMEETPEACEHRWKLLRNKYTGLKRDIKNTPSGSEASENSWPYFRSMGFLDKFLQTRKSYSNMQKGNRPESQEWDSLSTITSKPSDSQENDSPDDVFLQESEEEGAGTPASSKKIPFSERVDESQNPGCSKSGKIPYCKSSSNITTLKRNHDETIPRHTIPSKKNKSDTPLSEKIGGCFETFNKVLEKNINEQQPTSMTVTDEEHFVRSLAADMSIFTQKQKIILKKKMYQVIGDYLESIEDSWG